jgi:hypothetical protein
MALHLIKRLHSEERAKEVIRGHPDPQPPVLPHGPIRYRESGTDYRLCSCTRWSRTAT